MVDYDYSCMIYLIKKWIPNKIKSDWIRLHISILFIWFNWFDKYWTQGKIDVQLGLITESTQMIGVWLGLIEFCFNFVQLDMPALLNGGSIV